MPQELRRRRQGAGLARLTTGQELRSAQNHVALVTPQRGVIQKADVKLVLKNVYDSRPVMVSVEAKRVSNFPGAWEPARAGVQNP